MAGCSGRETRARAKFFEWIKRRAIPWAKEKFGESAAAQLQREMDSVVPGYAALDKPRHADLRDTAAGMRLVIEEMKLDVAG